MPFSAIEFKSRPSSSLVISLFFLSVIAILVTVVFSRTNANVRSTGQRVNTQEAIRVAEAGIEKAVWCMNNPANTINCPGNPGFVGESNVSLGRGRFTTAISGSGSNRIINSYGTVGNVTKHLQIRLTTTTANVSFSYGLQAGVGGLVMKNNNVITGNVFSNGQVTGTKSLISGDVILAVREPTVDVSLDPPTNPLNEVVLGQTSTSRWLAQSFYMNLNEKIYSLDLKIARRGAPPAATIAIYSDSGNQPGTSLYSQTITAGADTSGWENIWQTQVVTPSSSPQLSVLTRYWLVITVSGTGDANNYWRVVRSSDDSFYSAGVSKTSTNGTTWTAVNYDTAMKLTAGGIASTLEVNCSGVLCPNGNGIGGNAYAATIKDTVIGQHACYQSLIGTVRAHLNSDCSNSANHYTPTPPYCDNNNTVANTGPYCHPNNPNLVAAEFPLTQGDITAMKLAAENANVITGNYTWTNNQLLGPAKIVGDLTINAGSSTPAILTGTLWVVGNIYLDGAVKLSNSYGPESGVLIADNPSDPLNSGRIIVGNTGQLLGNATADTYIMGLSNSTNLTEANAAIAVSNNLTAGVVYAANGAVDIRNSANLKEVTGQKIVMQNNTTITYQTGLASVVFSSGPGGSWVYRKGTYRVID